MIKTYTIMDEEALKKKLTFEQYRILREKGTEPAFTGKYYNTKDKGMYNCAACGNKLFSSDTKFDSGSGWPSFDDAVKGNVELKEDFTHGMQRIEVICKKCKSHLGHLFHDGPTKTKKRYCINSARLNLKKK
jgi:peptide-methionine (R)-S-oxide reductase